LALVGLSGGFFDHHFGALRRGLLPDLNGRRKGGFQLGLAPGGAPPVLAGQVE